MDSSTWFPAVAALMGTVLGALLTGLTQHKSAIDTQVRQARMSAYSDYAGALQEFRQLAITRFHLITEGEVNPRIAARRESEGGYYPTKAKLLAQQNRAILLASSKDLRSHIERCTRIALDLPSMPTKEQLNEATVTLETELATLLDLASLEVKK